MIQIYQSTTHSYILPILDANSFSPKKLIIIIGNNINNNSNNNICFLVHRVVRVIRGNNKDLQFGKWVCVIK